MRGLDRRNFLGLAVTGIAVAGCRSFAGSRKAGGSGGRFRAGAIDAGHWLTGHALPTPHGLTWAATPPHAETIQANLYSGASGVLLALAELHRATGESSWRDVAGRGGADLAARLDQIAGDEGYGLYSGLAGVAFALDHCGEAFGDGALREGARRAHSRIVAAAKSTPTGVAWGETNDIVSGTAGIGCYLLFAAERFSDPASRALAVRAGDELLARAIEAEGGYDWEISPGFERRYPNFAHGTAGVAYFLATLGVGTGEKRFLAAAERGASHLEAIAKIENDTFLVYRHAPDARDIYYLGWCHGPAGTARLFYRLWRATRATRYRLRLEQATRALTTCGLPEARTNGYWNNVSRCCGAASVGEFLLAVEPVLGGARASELAIALGDDLIARSTRDAAGARSWIQAENRAEPENLATQTGLMQGASGVALYLLRLAAALAGERWHLKLPDSPFAEG